MIAGLTGAGKTTYAEALRRDLSAVRFSIDDWNARLFFPDRDAASDFDWFYERVQRACAQMRATGAEVLEAGVPAVFDCGFTNARERGIFYDWADGLGRPVILHHLSADPATCWDRVQRRNAERGETFALEVSRGMFDLMLRLWDPPSAAEMAQRSGVLVEA